MTMGYRSAGIFTIVVGIILVPALLVGVLLILRGLKLLALGARSVPPGSDPQTCDKWGHDMRGQIPGYPAGTTCRNCLTRKDGAMIAWSYAPSGIPALPFPGTPHFVPYNAPKSKKVKKAAQPTFLPMGDAPGAAAPQDIKMEIVGFGRP